MDCADIIPLDDARKLSIANNILTCKNTVESGQTFFESYGYRGVRLGNNALIINSVAALLMILEAIGLPYVKYVDW